MPKVGPIGVDTIIEPAAERIGEGQRIAFLSKLNPKGDARTARGMFENRGVDPVMIQPGSHRDHRPGEIGADTTNFHDVEHGCARSLKIAFAARQIVSQSFFISVKGCTFDLDQSSEDENIPSPCNFCDGLSELWLL
jgi:hypothetical protein